jgi:small subunit ribosomal protein S18
MARSNYRGGTRRAAKDLNRRVKKKPCALCRDRVEWVDYKDVPLLRKFMSDRGKIRSRRVTGNCAQHQRDVAQAIKTARELVLLPYTQRTVTERPGGRGGRGSREGRGRPPAATQEPSAEGSERSTEAPAVPEEAFGDAGEVGATAEALAEVEAPVVDGAGDGEE